jgi:hypothetical protein
VEEEELVFNVSAKLLKEEVKFYLPRLRIFLGKKLLKVGDWVVK